MESLLSTLNFILSIVIGLFLLVILVVIHELGHAIAARRNGVVVEEFGIGFPPQAWAKKLKNGVLFTLNWLPLGGFVRLKGETDSSTGEGAYGQASLWAKTKIMLAGVFMNFVTAAVIFSVLALFGLPKVIPDQFTVPADTNLVRKPVTAVAVTKDSPASRAGIQSGNQIIALAGTPIDTPKELVEVAKQNAGKTVSVAYRDDGVERVNDITLNAQDQNNSGYLGVAPGQQELIKATWSAPIVGVATTVQLTQLTFEGLGQILVNLGKGIASRFSGDEQTRQAGQEALNSAGSGVAGPVGIFGTLFPQAREAGLIVLLFLTGVISLSLAVMNILPIPALDGGRLFVTLLFRGLRKPLTKEREEKINAIGFMFLIGLIIFITVLDIGRLTGGQ